MGPRNPIVGEVVGLPALDRFSVEMADPYRRTTIERVSVNVNGAFRFFTPPPDADVEIRVLNDRNVVIARATVRAGDPRPSLRIDVSDAGGQQRDPETGETVSAYRLSHKVPRKARSEYSNAMDDYKKKRLDEAVEHLKRAISIDDGYVEALNSLGGRLLELQRPAEAEPFLRKAMELDPGSPVPTLNLSLALVAQGRVAEAETLARKGMNLDGGSERARKVLDLCLRVQGKPTT